MARGDEGEGQRQPRGQRRVPLLLGTVLLGTLLLDTTVACSKSPPPQAPAGEATDEGAAEGSAAAATTGAVAPDEPALEQSEALDEESRQPAAAPLAKPSKPAPFSPKDFEPPHPATAAAGDGHWVAMGDAALGEPAGSTPHRLFRSTIHPHEKNRFISIDVVAVDLTRVSLHWIIGKKDQGATQLEPAMAPGLIPGDDQEHTLAVFNGGFQARHGWWGMMSDQITILKAKDAGCTVAIKQDGKVALGPWKALGLANDELAAFRQTPPCLLHDGKPHPNLERGSTRVWAGNNPDRKTRRRSAIGIDAEAKVLYFGIGTEAGPADLARGMATVGAVTVAQLDINWAWTRFLLAGRVEGRPRVTTSLVPDPLHGKNEYFSRPCDRDFFYLTADIDD